MVRLLAVCLTLVFLVSSTHAAKPRPGGNRLTYLDENNPYYPSRTFPKLITPQWVGDKGVEAVVILAIDDMRDPKKYEDYLRPILIRLKQIDGRAPVSIMTCNIDPKDEQIQKWLAEGLSIEVHTVDHPCPLLQGGDFKKAKSTYDRCVDLMNQIPGNRPVAFRMPCCDSLNTVSPRFYAEIFNKTTANGNFLSIDTSVFNIFTAADPDIPRELIFEPVVAEGATRRGGDAANTESPRPRVPVSPRHAAETRERFRKYIPKGLMRGGKEFSTFVNTIENYPYPYVINRLCWEFPCVVPSDWEAQHLQKPNNPQTVRDMQAALDITVLKQGVMNLVFHPHGWIRNDQIVELIDHAVKKHGNKVKFLTFKEALQRLNKNLLAGQSIRAKDGVDNVVRVLDVNNDGYLDVLVGNEESKQTRIWSPTSKEWIGTHFPDSLTFNFENRKATNWPLRFGIQEDSGFASLFLIRKISWGWHFDGKNWKKSNLTFLSPTYRSAFKRAIGSLVRDFDGDQRSEAILAMNHGHYIYDWDQKKKEWVKLAFDFPDGATLFAHDGKDAGLRFVDLNEDGFDDIVFSNHERYGIWLFKDMQTGWSRKVLSGKRASGRRQPSELPPIVRQDGSDNGFFVHSRHLFWQNEDTDKLKDLVDRRSFDELLKDVEPKAKSPRQSLKLIEPRPGFTVELMAAEPLVMDPVAFEWGPDGKLWVAEMADYPLGIPAKDKQARSASKGSLASAAGLSHGGRVRFLEDTNGDGRYDKSTLFLDGLSYPNGVMPWRKGVLISAAPDILYAEDTDGDGRADKRVVLYTGFKQGNQQHRVNGFAYGLDNWIHCANGDSGGRIKSLKTGQTIDISGRDLRIRPETGELDAQTGRTQFGRNRDDWGNWFGCNNSNPMFHFALADHYIRRNRYAAAPDSRVHVSVTPGAAPCFPTSRTVKRFNDPEKRNRFTSACSAMVYRDELFGPEFAGNWFVCEPVHNLVHREVMSAQGVTFTSRRADDERQSEFLASRDNWFRPTMVKTGPDGALWIADMYRETIEHPEWIPDDWEKRLDLRAGHDKGRLYRVYPLDKKPRAIPRLDRLSTPELVAALESPSGWRRDTAQRLLIEQRDGDAIAPLRRLAVRSQQPLARLHALCTLDGINALTPAVLTTGLSDPHPGVRRHAVRLAERRVAESASLAESLLKRVDDPDLQVQLQLAYSLGAWNDSRTGQALARLAVRHQADRFLMAAVMSSVNKSNLGDVLTAVLKDADRKSARSRPLQKLLALAAAFGNDRAVVDALGPMTTAKDGTFAAWQMNALRELIDALARRGSSIRKLIEPPDETLDRIHAMFKASFEVAVNREMSEADRIAAIRLLSRASNQGEAIAIVGRFLVPQESGGIQSAVVSALSDIDDPAAADALLKGWKGYGPQLRSQVLEVLLSRQAATGLLLTSLEQRRVLPAEIDAARRQRLLKHPNATIRERAEDVLAGTIDPNRQKVIAAYRTVLTMRGSARRGAEVFKKRCSVCHKLNGEGKQLGPDLAALTDKSAGAMLTAILDPNRAVEAKFVAYTALTKQGRVHSGLLTVETGNSITLVDQEGKSAVLLRTNLEELISSNKSFMPEGVEKDLSPQDVADVIAYINAAASGP